MFGDEGLLYFEKNLFVIFKNSVSQKDGHGHIFTVSLCHLLLLSWLHTTGDVTFSLDCTLTQRLK